MSIQSLCKSVVLFSIAFLFAIPAFGAQSGSGNTTANGCTINTAYIPQGNLYIRFSANSLCGSIEVFDSQGGTHLAWSAVNSYSGGSLYSAASMENGVIFIPTPYLEAGNPVTFTIRAHNPSNWSDYSEATVTYGGGLVTGCILKTFSYTVSGGGIPNNVVYDYTHSAYGGWICIPVFNGVQNLNSPITSNFQGGVNTMAVWAVPPGGGVGGTGSFVSDAVVFNYPGGGGGGGSIPTSIEVDIQGLSNPNLASWAINPGAYSGSGNATVDVSSNVLDGRTYTISPGVVPGCTLQNVINTDGGGSSMTVYPGAAQGYTVTYSCSSQTVDIKADNSDGPIFLTPGQASTLTWTSNGVSTCTASGSWSGSKSTAGSQSTGALSTGTYDYVINCTGQNGTVSDIVQINVSGTPPPAPTITASTSGTCSSVDISWSGYNTSLSTGFKVYRAGVLIATLGNVTSYTDNGLSAGTYAYTVKAFNGVGDSASSNSSSATASAQCPASAPVVTLSANPTTTSNGDSTLTWTVTNSPTSCTATNDKSNSQWNGGKSIAGASQLITNITTTTIFSLSCSNNSGPSNVATVTVTYSKVVGQPPFVTLTANKSTVNEGQSSILTWSVTNSPTSCTASGGNSQWAGSVISPKSGGSKTITNISSADINDFKLQCTNGQLSNLARVDIMVTSDPVGPTNVNLRANPTTVTSGGSTVLTWDPVLNAQSCGPNASDFGSSWYNPNVKSTAGGSQTIPNLTQTTTFTLICQTSTGAISQSSVTVTVSAGTATLNVTSNNASGSWSISPGGIVGSGTSGSSTVTPNSGGTVYTISANSIPNYSTSVSYVRNGVSGSGSAVTVFPGDTITYAITYTSTGLPFDYLLSNPGTLTITKGASPVTGQKNAGKTLTQGTPQQVDTDLTGLPSGVSVTYANRSCSPNPTCTTGMTFTVDPSATVGTYPLVLKGTTSGLADKTQNFNLVIANASPLTVDVSSNPSSTARVGDTVTWTCTASGGSGVYTYTWSGTGVPSPAPTTSSFTITYQTVGAKTAVCNVNDGTQSAGSIERAVQVSVNPIFIEF